MVLCDLQQVARMKRSGIWDNRSHTTSDSAKLPPGYLLTQRTNKQLFGFLNYEYPSY